MLDPRKISYDIIRRYLHNFDRLCLIFRNFIIRLLYLNGTLINLPTDTSVATYVFYFLNIQPPNFSSLTYNDRFDHKLMNN